MKVVVLLIFVSASFALKFRRDIPGLPSSKGVLPIHLNKSLCDYQSVQAERTSLSEDYSTESKPCFKNYHPMKKFQKKKSGVACWLGRRRYFQ